MMAVDLDSLKQLRKATGAGIVDCKKALEESGGDMQKAITILREKGIKVASKKANREADEGLVVSYIHPPGKMGVLVEINCETDFVARTEDFKNFARKVAMHIAAYPPVVVSRADLSEEAVEAERKVLMAQLEGSGKPPEILEKIIDGRMEKLYEEACLLDQEWSDNPEVGTVKDALTDLIGKLRENIIINRFARFSIGH
ncbi:MAG: translation elongation factor Ts [Candidatus Fermentibacteraceae bacterium]|nr:translation elongation factor Ts [Candidatus Fermentibacteraceae bacterium]